MKLTINDVIEKLNELKESNSDFHLGDMLLDICEAIQAEKARCNELFSLIAKCLKQAEKEQVCHSLKEKQPRAVKVSRKTSVEKSKPASRRSKR